MVLFVASLITGIEGDLNLDCMTVSLMDEFRVPCSHLPKNLIRPCLVLTDGDQNVLISANVSSRLYLKRKEC